MYHMLSCRSAYNARPPCPPFCSPLPKCRAWRTSRLSAGLARCAPPGAPNQTAREFGAFLTAETDRYARVIRATGLRLETPSS